VLRARRPRGRRGWVYVIAVPFWMLAGLSLLAIGAVLRSTPAALGNRRAEVSVRAELCTLRPWRMWVVLGAIVLAQAGFLGAYSYISPLLTDRAGIPAVLVPVVLVGFGIGALGARLLAAVWATAAHWPPSPRQSR
jgi:predicted MFS family arabinose efflux permease